MRLFYRVYPDSAPKDLASNTKPSSRIKATLAYVEGSGGTSALVATIAVDVETRELWRPGARSLVIYL